jgi:UDP-N-acetylmuramyl pentapeptide phosphotransferase/UDP-N-acetylglucosamine-1-phosphate transferase
MGIFLNATLVSFVTVVLVIPVIIVFSKNKYLLDQPDNYRKLHSGPTPTMGGFAIFLGIFFSSTIFSSFYSSSQQITLLLLSSLVILLLGIIDDMFQLSPLKKIIGQLLVVVILIFFLDIRIDRMYGLLGIDYIPVYVSMLVTMFTILVIVNGFNLIDGVDGLAGVLGFIAATFLGVYFYVDSQYVYSILSFALAGSIFGFLIFNFSPAKIFLGDGGSMFIGLILAILTIRFIVSAPLSTKFSIQDSPAVGFGLLAIPLLDTLRVFIIRLSRGLSPFSPDRNHIHHMLQDLGFSHILISLSLGAYSIIILLMSWVISLKFTCTFAIFSIGLLYYISVLFIYLLRKNRSNSTTKVFSINQERA